MDEKLRKKLSEPLGMLMDFGSALEKINFEKPSMLVAIGDASIFFLLEKNILPDVFVFDLKCKRKPVEKRWGEEILKYANSGDVNVINAKNPAGTVSSSLEKAVKKCFLEGKGGVHVEGEDDLATLACVVHAPLGAVVLYGQPDRGIVWVGVDEKMKKKATALMKKVRGE